MQIRLTTGAIQPVTGTYIHLHTTEQHVHKEVNKSTNTKLLHKPRSPLASYNPGTPPIPRDGGPDRSYTGKVGSHPGAVTSNPELQQREEAPRGRR